MIGMGLVEEGYDYGSLFLVMMGLDGVFVVLGFGVCWFFVFDGTVVTTTYNF